MGLARCCLPACSPSFTDVWWGLSSRESQAMTVTQRGTPTKADVWACCAQMEAGGGLLVRLDKSRAGVPRTAAAVAARWFAQDIFSGPGLAEDGEDEATHASASAQPAAGTLVVPQTRQWHKSAGPLVAMHHVTMVSMHLACTERETAVLA